MSALTLKLVAQGLLIASMVASAHLASANVIITEIMFDPQGSDRDSIGVDYTYNREWVELFNTGSSAIDLGGWQFGDSLDNNWAAPFPANTIINPQQVLVVTGDAASFDANWGDGVNRIQIAAFPNLANSVGTNEAAAIRNSSGAIQDAVRFQEVGWPTADGSDGNSIALVPSGLSPTANDLAANWKPASQGVYGARYTAAGGQGENHGSPGIVATQTQAAFVPSPDAAWSMIILPDTQNYSKSSVNNPIFSQLTNWIKGNRDEFNIQVVLQEGDIVNKNDNPNPSSELPSDQQWANARAAMSILDGHVPYIMSAGNHDFGINSAENRSTQFNTYFQASQNPLVDPAQGGILRGYFEPDRLENAYFEVQAPDGRDMLIFSLEFWPRQAVVNWANQIAGLPQHQDHTAVLLTHSYLNPNNTRSDGVPDAYPGVGDDANDGEQLWHELVKLHGNFELTFNGHVGGDEVGYLRSVGIDGNAVHQMVFNAQFETNGGNGWLRVVEFLEDGTTVRVRTYSPFLDLYRTGPAHEFEIELSQLSMIAGDFNADGLVDSFDLAAWRSHLGMAAGADRIDGNADADGDVDGADFLAWQINVGATPTTAAANPVPEPAALVMATLVVAATAIARRRGR